MVEQALETSPTDASKASNSLHITSPLDEKTIDDILTSGLEANIDKKEREDVDDDRQSRTSSDANDRREPREKDHKAGAKSGKEASEAGDKKEKASDQSDSTGRRDGALDQDKSKDESTHAQDSLLADRAQKLEEELSRNKKWGHDLARKLKSYQQKLETYAEEGKLTLDEAKELYSETRHEMPQEEESLYERYARIWDCEIENIRKYAPDENLDKHIMGFQAKMKTSSQEEINETFKAFQQEEDPVSLTRAMLKEGETYYNKVLSKIEPYGGVEGYITHMEKAIEKARSKVDTLKQEVIDLKSEGYLTPSAGYSLPSHGDEGQYQKDMALDSVFERARHGRI